MDWLYFQRKFLLPPCYILCLLVERSRYFPSYQTFMSTPPARVFKLFKYYCFLPSSYTTPISHLSNSDLCYQYSLLSLLLFCYFFQVSKKLLLLNMLLLYVFFLLLKDIYIQVRDEEGVALGHDSKKKEVKNFLLLLY